MSEEPERVDIDQDTRSVKPNRFRYQSIMAESPVYGRNQRQRKKRPLQFCIQRTKEIRDMLALHRCDRRTENSIGPPSVYGRGIPPQNRKNKRLHTRRRETRFIESPEIPETCNRDYRLLTVETYP